ncbi:MAG: hypothetical protein AAGA99_21295 [Actinomycetota bacterium]
MAESEPVKLRDLVHSLASIMVGTTRYLDQSTVDLQRLYGESVGGSLESFTAPRFTLDEVTVDLSFLVDQVVTEPEPPQPVRPLVELGEVAGRLQNALAKLQQEDEGAFDKHREQLADFERAFAAWEAEVKASAFPEQLRDLANERRAIEQRLRTLGGRVNADLVARSTVRLTEIAARVAEINVQNAALLGPRRPKPPPAPPGFPGVDYVALWATFEDEYRIVRQWYADAVDAFEEGRAIPAAPPTSADTGQVRTLVGRATMGAATRSTVEALINGRDLVVADAEALLVTIADAKGAGILVRVDPSSIAEADEDALQKLQLTFRAEAQETVDVDGDRLEIPR